MVRKLILAASLSLLLVFSFAAPSSAQGRDAQLRFAHFVADAPNVDVFFNGVRTLQGYEPTWLSTFIDVQAGSLDVVIAPEGAGTGGALVSATDLDLQAGHRYSLAFTGTNDDPATLLIDETEALEGCDMSKSNFRIIVNNIDGAPPISFYEGDEWREQNIQPGTYSAACFPAFVSDTAWAVAGTDRNDVIFTFDADADGTSSLWEPYTVYFEGMMGSYPGTEFEDYYFSESNVYTLAPDPIAFLEAFNGLNLTYNGEIYLEFTKVIAAIKDAGLEDMLREDGSYTMFVPTDQGLRSLNKRGQALLNNPDTLRDVLLYHIVEGSPNYDDLTSAGSVETLQGSDLIVTTDPEDEGGYYFYLNDDAQVDNYRYTMQNGWRLYFINNYAALIPSSLDKQ
jgi:hypothetical protein